MSLSGKNIVTAAALLLALGSSRAQAQDQYYTKIDHKLSLGFQTGGSFQLFPLYTPKKKKTYSRQMSLSVRLALNNHLRVAAGLQYSIFNTNIQQAAYKQQITKPYTMAAPLSLEYHFCKKGRLHPYVGAGVQYNFNVTNNTSQYKPDWKPDYNTLNNNPGQKHISVIFTQGFIYEINTKIQVNQSFHFIPESGIKTIGLDVGIGLTLP